MRARDAGRPDRAETPHGVIDFHVHRVPRRRHVHILVDDEAEVRVRVPWHCPRADARAFVVEHAGWIIEQVARARARRRRRPRLASGARLPLLDEELVLRVEPRAQMELLGAGGAPPRRPAVERAGATLLVRPDRVGTARVRDLLEGWYRREARRVLSARVDALGAPLGLAPRRLRIAGQRTCWGSCSSRGTISLNWRLMLVPARLADYVVVHELCHLRHLDHSARFWDLVATLVPDHAARRAELRERQPDLAI